MKISAPVRFAAHIYSGVRLSPSQSGSGSSATWIRHCSAQVTVTVWRRWPGPGPAGDTETVSLRGLARYGTAAAPCLCLRVRLTRVRLGNTPRKRSDHWRDCRWPGRKRSQVPVKGDMAGERERSLAGRWCIFVFGERRGATHTLSYVLLLWLIMEMEMV